MKHSISIFLVIFLLITVKSFSQGTDGVLIDPNNAITRDASAVFQAQSTSQGVLVPRMTAAQRVAIPVNAARDGLMVYQTDAPVGFYYYNGPTLTWVLIANTTSNLAGVTAGTGLTGGGTSGTITVNAVGDNGLTTNADDIDLGGPLTQAATTITQDGSETFTIANTGTGNTTINLTSTGDFDVQDNGTSALFVRDDAFVGVGTNAPNSPFTVRTTVATANARTTSLANAIGDVNFQLATVRGATTNAVGDITTQIGQVYGAGALTEGIQFIRGGGSTDGSMAFVTNAATERMRISSNGNVGIGSNNPTERLEVSGAIKIPAASTTDNNSPALTMVSDDDFLYDTEYLNHYALGFHQFNDGAGLGANLYASGYYGIDLFTGGAQRLRINNNGTVKINNLAGAGSRVVVADASGNLSATTSIGTGIVTGNGTQNYIPKWNNAAGTTLGNSLITDDATTITAAGQFDVTGGTGTSYTTAPIEIRTSAIAPRLAFHYSGVVASQIAVENSGTIAIRDNPGTGYENFIARDISANRNIYNQGILYHRTSAGQGSGAHGISWYDPSFVTWYDYMAPPGTTNAPSGTAAPQDATTGVTSWARRFNMENIGTYGWLFESGANTAGVAPTVKFAINASNGNFHTIGNGYIDGTLKIAGGSPAAGRVLTSDAAGNATWAAPATSGTVTSVATGGNGITGGTITSTGTISLDYGNTTVAGNGLRPQGNFGQFQSHSAYTDANTVPNYWGWNYVQGSTNTPNATSSQWYREVISLGSEYPGRGAGGYSMELAFPRFSASSAGVWMRTVENGAIGGWSRIDAGGTTFAGTANYLARWTTATNLGIGATYDNGTNVGIGNAAPAHKLDVSGNIRATGALYANANGAAYLIGGDDATLNDVNIANTVGLIGAQNTALGSLQLGTNAGSTISGANGNVGISSITPGAKLDVIGAATGSGITIRAGGGGDVVLASGGTLFFDDNYSYASGNYIRPIGGANTMGFFTSGGERMRILANGNVGIANTAAAERLDVTGNIRASGIVYWGNAGTRTETRDDAGSQGGRSGFYETSVPAPAANWYSGASSWQHLFEARHSNTGNNYAMQLAGSFFDQRLYFRKTNNSATTAWSEVMTVPTGTNASTNQAYTLAMHGQFSNDDIGFGWAGNADDTYYSANMGWSITINGTAYSDLTLNTNGTIVFGSQTAYLGYGGTLPNGGTNLPVLAWYWRDMVTNYRWGSVGTAPNRVFIIDFDGNAYNTGDDVDGQIQIHETSGLINVFYRVMDAPVNGQNGVIGFQLQGGASAKTYPIVGYGKAFDDNRLPQSWSVSPVR